MGWEMLGSGFRAAHRTLHLIGLCHMVHQRRGLLRCGGFPTGAHFVQNLHLSVPKDRRVFRRKYMSSQECTKRGAEEALKMVLPSLRNIQPIILTHTTSSAYKGTVDN